MALKTNYKDDVFTGKRKYRLNNNSDGTVSLDDVTQYSQHGDSFGASDVNTINKEINNKPNHSDIDNIKSDVNQFSKKIISTIKTVTIQPTQWADGVFTLNDSLIEDENTIIDVDLAMNPTLDQTKAFAKALLVGYSQSKGQMKLKAMGKVPTINISLTVVFRHSNSLKNGNEVRY